MSALWSLQLFNLFTFFSEWDIIWRQNGAITDFGSSLSFSMGSKSKLWHFFKFRHVGQLRHLSLWHTNWVFEPRKIQPSPLVPKNDPVWDGGQGPSTAPTTSFFCQVSITYCMVWGSRRAKNKIMAVNVHKQIYPPTPFVQIWVAGGFKGGIMHKLINALCNLCTIIINNCKTLGLLYHERISSGNDIGRFFGVFLAFFDLIFQLSCCQLSRVRRAIKRFITWNHSPHMPRQAAKLPGFYLESQQKVLQ